MSGTLLIDQALGEARRLYLVNRRRCAKMIAHLKYDGHRPEYHEGLRLCLLDMVSQLRASEWQDTGGG